MTGSYKTLDIFLKHNFLTGIKDLLFGDITDSPTTQIRSTFDEEIIHTLFNDPEAGTSTKRTLLGNYTLRLCRQT